MTGRRVMLHAARFVMTCFSGTSSSFGIMKPTRHVDFLVAIVGSLFPLPTEVRANCFVGAGDAERFARAFDAAAVLVRRAGDQPDGHLFRECVGGRAPG